MRSARSFAPAHCSSEHVSSVRVTLLARSFRFFCNAVGAHLSQLAGAGGRISSCRAGSEPPAISSRRDETSWPGAGLDSSRIRPLTGSRALPAFLKNRKKPLQKPPEGRSQEVRVMVI